MILVTKLITLRDKIQLGIVNGEVAKLSLKKKAVIITLDSDFLTLKKSLQKQSRIIYLKIHPRDPKEIAKLIRKYLDKAMGDLKNPGKVVISKNGVIFKDPENYEMLKSN